MEESQLFKFEALLVKWERERLAISPSTESVMSEASMDRWIILDRRINKLYQWMMVARIKESEDLLKRNSNRLQKAN